jgi:retron-type reverse transcriptase
MMGKLLQVMAHDLLVSVNDLGYLVRSAPYRYKVYEIKKRQPGKMRTIAQPAREVKRLQYWIIANVLKRYPVHRAAMAYRKGKSILNNAKAHAKKRYLLKLDFRDFFHSIKAIDFKQFVEKDAQTDIDGADLECLTRVLFWKNKQSGEFVLSIGAPSSPMLSNILLYEFDRRATEYCVSAGVTYTRYADDLTFSTNKRNVLGQVADRVDRICADLPYPRLTLNSDKTVHASRGTTRRVTGLILSNEGVVSIGHERKRQLHAAVHRFKFGRLDPTEAASLAGTLSFVNSAEPKFLRVLARRYGKTVIRRLFAANRVPWGK